MFNKIVNQNRNPVFKVFRKYSPTAKMIYFCNKYNSYSSSIHLAILKVLKQLNQGQL